MTTIIYHKNSLYADSRITQDGFIVSESYNKLLKLTSGNKTLLAGGAGSVSSIIQFFDWIKDGMDNASKPDLERFEGIVILKNKNKVNVYNYEDCLIPIVISEKYYAFGSGGSLAMAMIDVNSTLDPAKIIKAVSKRDVYTNDRVKSVSF